MKYSCKLCNYNTYFLSKWKQHENTKKHKNNGIKTITFRIRKIFRITKAPTII